MKRESHWQSWLTSVIMSHDVPAKTNIVSYVVFTGLRCAMEAIMSHVGNHDSRQSTALIYQFLRWNLSCKISWVGRNLLFKLGFLVPLRTEGFSCYNPTETGAREITRCWVKQINKYLLSQFYWMFLWVTKEKRKFPLLSKPCPQAFFILFWSA